MKTVYDFDSLPPKVPHPFYKDLTPYSKNIEPKTLKGVTNIGWIDIRQGEYPQGVVPKDFLEKLALIMQGNKSFSCYTGVSRVSPHCITCGEVTTVGKNIPLLNAEIWIPSTKVNEAYASPSLIYHYVEKHSYLPPEEYIKAVLALDLSTSFDAEQYSRQKEQESGITPEFLYKKHFGK